MNKERLTLYLVTARYEEEDRDFLKKIEVACQSGVTLVQLREKEATTAAFYALAVKVKAITDQYNIPLIINDRVDICLAVDAAGVHIGDQELPVAVVRQLIGPDKWLGVSAKTVQRALQAEKEGADYLGVGAIFPTQTKVVTQATSIETLKAIVDAISIPVVAIGGIDETKLETFSGTGIAGVAVVSRIMKATDIPAIVETFKKTLEQTLGG
ncbi:thiamine phosphate synthase [Streptococcus moroccensis]|uniref:Thiamine-phosphate synthase n=1 Tax=Streptococcus moroccensis TaxID=1451356 RepID=A0ABT9YTQ2_9STRE|nr:thiamine phosphate synthase [Streptococcus moroccensis]MDQ0223374.1 thiamine-phosphate pyrophosphorylase [Streptococcus moroccensis]